MFGTKLTPRGRILVKICGITNEADAQMAIEAGADALGFNLVPHSKRHVQIDREAGWIRKLPPEICKVAVLADPNWEDACRIGQLALFDALQLHGKETPEFCRRLTVAGISFAKAIPVTGSKSLADLPNYFTDTMILDSKTGRTFGGTGTPFPWKFAPEFVRHHPKVTVILAGGLSPENVAEAVRVVRPRGVDVTTGVEASPGRKDASRVQAFIEAVRKASSIAN